jgi:hypothetical protein
MDDAEFEAYIGRRSRLSRRYRDLSSEIPPKELDEAVLTRARKAHTFKRNETPGREIYIGWMAPVAFAATVMLVFTVVLQIIIRPQIGVRQESAGEARAPLVAASPPPAVAADAKREVDLPIAEKLTPDDQPARRLTNDVPASAPAAAALNRAKLAAPQPARKDEIAEPAAPSVAAAGTALYKKDSAAETGSRQSIVTAGGRVSTASSESAGALTADVDAMRRDPIAWLAFIKKLRTNGDTASADRQMKLFLEKYPDYFRDHPLPDDAR